MQAYAASHDPEIGEVVRRGYGELVEYVERVSGLPPDRVAIGGGGRGVNLRVAGLDLVAALDAEVVDVTRNGSD